MEVKGSCHCGQITYKAIVDPEKVAICHCTDCQTLSGSAYRVVVPAPKETFSLLTGQPKIYVKTAESGRKRAQAFCSNCGSPIYAADLNDPPTYSLRVGCLEQRAELPPKRQIWCSTALEWAKNLEKIPQISRQ
jgi:hypothetical protein